MDGDHYLRDDVLDPDQREMLREYTVQRVGLDGELVWLLDELGELGDDPEPAPPAPAPHSQPTDPRAEYRAQAVVAPDPVDRAVAQRQLERLEREANRAADSPLPVSKWRHVPVAQLFEQAGNRLQRRADGRLECGHEPMHASKSRRCVLVDPAAGRWWCRSCRQGGDAVTFVMSWRGWTYRQAAAWLTERYGPPSDELPTPRRFPRRPVLVVEVPRAN